MPWQIHALFLETQGLWPRGVGIRIRREGKEEKKKIPITLKFQQPIVFVLKIVLTSLQLAFTDMPPSDAIAVK